MEFRNGSRGRVSTPPPPTPHPQDEAFLVFAFKICLPHQSVMPFLSGTSPPKKNPGSAPGISLNVSELHVYLSQGFKASGCNIPLAPIN